MVFDNRITSGKIVQREDVIQRVSLKLISALGGARKRWYNVLYFEMSYDIRLASRTNIFFLKLLLFNYSIPIYYCCFNKTKKRTIYYCYTDQAARFTCLLRYRIYKTYMHLIRMMAEYNKIS